MRFCLKGKGANFDIRKYPAHFGHGATDLFERLLLGNASVGEDCVGKDADTSSTDIAGQERVLLGAFDVLTKLLGVGPMIGKRAGQAQPIDITGENA